MDTKLNSHCQINIRLCVVESASFVSLSDKIIHLFPGVLNRSTSLNYLFETANNKYIEQYTRLCYYEEVVPTLTPVNMGIGKEVYDETNMGCVRVIAPRNSICEVSFANLWRA